MSDNREARPIDADELIKILEERAKIASIQEVANAYLRVKKLVEKMPTLVVIPMDVHRKCMEAEIKKRILTEEINRQILENYAQVVHAKWIKHYIKIGNFYWKYKCSMCDEFNKQYSPPYCPHCGAKMDGGKDDENA